MKENELICHFMTVKIKSNHCTCTMTICVQFEAYSNISARIQDDNIAYGNEHVSRVVIGIVHDV